MASLHSFPFQWKTTVPCAGQTSWPDDGSNVWFVLGFFSVCSELELPPQSHLHGMCGLVLEAMRAAHFVSEVDGLLSF